MSVYRDGEKVPKITPIKSIPVPLKPKDWGTKKDKKEKKKEKGK